MLVCRKKKTPHQIMKTTFLTNQALRKIVWSQHPFTSTSKLVFVYFQFNFDLKIAWRNHVLPISSGWKGLGGRQRREMRKETKIMMSIAQLILLHQNDKSQRWRKYRRWEIRERLKMGPKTSKLQNHSDISFQEF